jgi:hypothetical protein
MKINTKKEKIELVVENDIDKLLIGKLERELMLNDTQYKLHFDRTTLLYLEMDRHSFTAIFNRLLTI